MDFATALNVPQNEVEAPVNLPQGTYVWTVFKTPKIAEIKSAKGEWDIIEFPVRAVSAEDDVDPDDLAEFGKLTSAINRVSFMFTKEEDGDNDRKKTLDRLRNFMRDVLQVEADDSTTINEMIALSVNHQFMAQVEWTPNGDDVYVNIKNYSSLE